MKISFELYKRLRDMVYSMDAHKISSHCKYSSASIGWNIYLRLTIFILQSLPEESSVDTIIKRDATVNCPEIILKGRCERDIISVRFYVHNGYFAICESSSIIDEIIDKNTKEITLKATE